MNDAEVRASNVKGIVLSDLVPTQANPLSCHTGSLGQHCVQQLSMHKSIMERRV